MFSRQFHGPLYLGKVIYIPLEDAAGLDLVSCRFSRWGICDVSPVVCCWGFEGT